MSSNSKQYEEATKAILDALREHLGLSSVQGEVRYEGKSGTGWKVDASCYRQEDGALVLVECRRKTTRRVPQEEMAGFAFRVGDIGASGGLMVTPIGYQEGAKIVAKAARIGLATLNPDATDTEYVLAIAGRLFRGLLISDHGCGTKHIFVHRTCSACGSKLVTWDNGQTYICPVCESLPEKFRGRIP
ncbi:restriction endonuclease [Candidatus Bipolaricaulota bacterium]|nr:restriction endonuclease [Candidatus Bipolaricaulota bacterium]